MPKNIKLFYLINFLTSTRFYTPVMVIYFAQVTGSYTLAMTVLGADSLFTALLEIPTGVFSDLVGRKLTVIASCTASIVGMSWWAIGGNFETLLIGTFFTGMSGALSSGNDEALLYDSLREVGKQDKFHNFYSKSGSLNLVAFGTSALLGGIIAAVSISLTFWLSVLFKVFALATSFFLSNPPISKKIDLTPYAHLKEATQLFVTNPKLRLLTLSNALSNSLTESTYQFTPVFVNTLWPIWAVGIWRSGTNFANALSYFISGKVIDRFKALNALIGQFVASRVILIMAYSFPTVFSPILAMSASLIYGIGQVAQKSLLQKEFSDSQRATMGSLNSLLTSISFAVVSVLIGLLADKIGPRNILLLGEFTLLPILFIYWKLFQHHKYP